jgi:hypothetical protein
LLTITINGKGLSGAVTFDVSVSLERETYEFMGGTPAPTSTSGSNGARWEDVAVSPKKGSVVLEYRWRATAPLGSAYSVDFDCSSTKLSGVETGSISGIIDPTPAPLPKTTLVPKKPAGRAKALDPKAPLAPEKP